MINGINKIPGEGESTDKTGDQINDIIITVTVPKPEAHIFSPKMETKYNNITPLRSFLHLIRKPVDQNHPAFRGL